MVGRVSVSSPCAVSRSAADGGTAGQRQSRVAGGRGDRPPPSEALWRAWRTSTSRRRARTPSRASLSIQLRSRTGDPTGRGVAREKLRGARGVTAGRGAEPGERRAFGTRSDEHRRRTHRRHCEALRETAFLDSCEDGDVFVLPARTPRRPRPGGSSSSVRCSARPTVPASRRDRSRPTEERRRAARPGRRRARRPAGDTPAAAPKTTGTAEWSQVHAQVDPNVPDALEWARPPPSRPTRGHGPDPPVRPAEQALHGHPHRPARRGRRGAGADRREPAGLAAGAVARAQEAAVGAGRLRHQALHAEHVGAVADGVADRLGPGAGHRPSASARFGADADDGRAGPHRLVRGSPPWSPRARACRPW